METILATAWYLLFGHPDDWRDEDEEDDDDDEDVRRRHQLNLDIADATGWALPETDEKRTL